MKLCCVFSYDTPYKAINHFEYDVVRDLGNKVYNDDGSIKHSTYAWDSGGRKIIQCKKCNAIFLYQWSEFHDSIGDQDSFYENYFLVESFTEAISLNNKHNGFELETKHTGLRLWNSDGVWCWNREEVISERH